MPTFIFVIKQYLHLHPLWSRTIICLCNETALALFFWHKAASTFYLYWGHIYTSFIPKLCQHPFFSMKPQQHSICIEVMPTFIFIMKPRQHSTLALALALKLHQYLHWATSKLYLHRNYANVHLCHEATTTLHLYWSRANIHLFHEATSTLHLYWSRANIHEAMSKLYLHQRRANIHLCHGATSTLYLH